MKNKLIGLVILGIVVAAAAGAWQVYGPALFGLNNSLITEPIHSDRTSIVEWTINMPEKVALSDGVRKQFPVSLNTSDYEGIARVEYWVDGTFIGYSTAAPFEISLDITGYSDGEHSIFAVIYSVEGRQRQTDVFTFVLTKEVSGGSDNEEAPGRIPQGRYLVSSEVRSDPARNIPDRKPDTGGENSDGVDMTPWPDVAPARVCGNSSLLSGPSKAPAGATVVPAGDNSNFDFTDPNTIYWFAPGVHTLGTEPFAQIIPRDNTTFVGAPGAILDGQNINRYAFTQHGVNVRIQYLTIRNFTAPRDEGTVNHDSGVGWTIEYNTIHNNGGAGVFAGTDNVIRYNCLKDNSQYGFQVYSNHPDGPSNVVLDHNEIVGNNTGDWEAIVSGCGCTGGGKFWDAHGVTVTNNYVHHNHGVGLWADTNDSDFLVEGNYIERNEGQGFFYEASYNAIVRNNNFIRNALVAGPENPSFPTGAIYLSESGGDARVAGRTDKIEIYDNHFEDNWSGVILWENADRFCGSPANTSSGECTEVNPAATTATCADPAMGGSIDSEPYYSDCRWKTQNVLVRNNTFKLSRSAIADCTQGNGCGYQGVFSNYGTFPAWSPYKGDAIRQAITFQQNNQFRDNTYIGDWMFKAFDMPSSYNFAIWQTGPYQQDVGSTYNGRDRLLVPNALSHDSESFEGSLGDWTSWFNASVSRSSSESHGGNYSMRIDQLDAFWGVEIRANVTTLVTPTAKKLSFWAKSGSGSNLGVMLQVQWQDGNGTLIETTKVPLKPLASSWQLVEAPVVPPAGTEEARVTFTSTPGGSGTAGDYFYLDDIFVADAE